jgi:hypothetical protein
MAVASFEDLCAGFCELAGVKPPVLSVSESGLIAFHVVLSGVTVNIVQRPEESNEHVFVLFELGPVGSDDSSPSLLQALLDANYAPLQVNPPVFSRNPINGNVALQLVYSLFEATPNDLRELIDTGTDRLAHWRETVPSEDDAGVYRLPGEPALAMPHHLA